MAPTDDEELAVAYHWLVAHSNESSTVPLGLAKKKVAQETGYDVNEVHRFVLLALARREYVSINDSPPGVKSDGTVHVCEIREE